MPVYILDGNCPNFFPGDEGPVPADGNPHPLPHHWPPVAGNVQSDWVQELQGGVNIDIPPHVQNHIGQEAEEEDADWMLVDQEV